MTADGPGMMHVTGLVGYHGKHGCRLYCGMPGHREVHRKQYFPALLKLINYSVEGCVHDCHRQDGNPGKVDFVERLSA